MSVHLIPVSQIYAHNFVCTQILMPGSNTRPTSCPSLLHTYAVIECCQRLLDDTVLKFTWNSGYVTQNYTEQCSQI